MKLFNSLQELWNYCGFCPLCRKNCRDIEISVGPDKSFQLENITKDQDFLKLRCAFKNNRNIYIVEYRFNLLNNNCNMDVTNVSVNSWFGAYNSCPLKDKLLDVQKIKEEYFYFYIQSSCKECGFSRVHSMDLELDVTEQKVYNIGLEVESLHLLKSKDKFHVSLIYDRNVMLVTRCHEDKEGDLIENEKAIELPLVKLDFLDQNKVVDKIKTLILFS